MPLRTLLILGSLLALPQGTFFPSAHAADSDETTIGGMSWHTDYATALSTADQTNRRLFVYFHSPDSAEACETFEQATLADASMQRELLEMVRVATPLDTTIRLDDQDITLVNHSAFAELHGCPGTAIIDFTLGDPTRRGLVDAAGPLAKGVIPGVQPEPKFEPKLAPEPRVDATNVVWFDNYAEATKTAKRQQKMLLVYFRDSDDKTPCNAFEQGALASPEVIGQIDRNYVAVRLASSSKVLVDDQETTLLEHESFAEMLQTPGVAVVDYASLDPKYLGQVVSTFPFLHGKPYTPEETLVILNLPRGTLTQRTLIYAVRTHPENPASTQGRLDDGLVEEARSHSKYQAKIRLQGHHNWSSRFRRINTTLSTDLLACEVCAESWPDENLVEAAIECVRCWRFSEGHWSAVRAKHAVWGYDMKRGDNRIWYATGVFGQDRKKALGKGRR